jgi:hypothetical protein
MVRLEKEYFLPAKGPELVYKNRLVNLSTRPRKLQMEHFFVWNTDDSRDCTSFILPQNNGIDELRLPQYEDIDCRAVVPAQPWGAFVDRKKGIAVVFLMSGIWRVQRYIAGDCAQFSGYTSEVILAHQACLSCTHRLYVISNLHKESVKIIEPIRQAIVHSIERKEFSPDERSFEDILPEILPQPLVLVREPGVFLLDKISLDCGAAEQEGEIFKNQFLARYGIKVLKKGRPNMQFILSEMADKQAYKLVVRPEKILISGSKEGIQYGSQTLLNLIVKAGNSILIPCCTVEDKPDIPLRGMLMFPSGPRWDKLVKLFAEEALMRFKFNAFMIHLTPDRIRFTEPIEGVTISRNAIGDDYLQRLREDLCKMHIKLLPFFPVNHIKCPESQKKETFIATMFLRRIVEILQPPFVNIGFDELGRFSVSCECCRKRKNHEIFVRAVSFFHNFLKRCGSRAAIYCDMLYRKRGDTLGWLDDSDWAIRHLPKDIVLNDYQYDPSTLEYARLRSFRKAGFETLLGTPWSTEENVLAWARSTRKYGASGLIGASWAEGPSHTSPGHMEGVIWTGAYGWRIGAPSVKDAQAIVPRMAREIAERYLKRAGY